MAGRPCTILWPATNRRDPCLPHVSTDRLGELYSGGVGSSRPFQSPITRRDAVSRSLAISRRRGGMNESTLTAISCGLKVNGLVAAGVGVVCREGCVRNGSKDCLPSLPAQRCWRRAKRAATAPRTPVGTELGLFTRGVSAHK